VYKGRLFRNQRAGKSSSLITGLAPFLASVLDAFAGFYLSSRGFLTSPPDNTDLKPKLNLSIPSSSCSGAPSTLWLVSLMTLGLRSTSLFFVSSLVFMRVSFSLVIHSASMGPSFFYLSLFESCFSTLSMEIPCC
jgi:hypothetical protein